MTRAREVQTQKPLMTCSKVFCHVWMIVGKERLGRVGKIWMILVEVVLVPLLIDRRVWVWKMASCGPWIVVWHGRLRQELEDKKAIEA